jgi:hypothetical protein
MRNAGRFSRWVAALALTSCLAPTAWGRTTTSVSREIGVGRVAGFLVYLLKEPEKKHKKVPEGGSPFVYLGITGVSCLCAITAKRRRQKRLNAPF